MDVNFNDIKNVWRIIITSKRGLTLSKLKSMLDIPDDVIDNVIALLHKYYLIEYMPTESGNDVIIRKRYILGNPLDDIPCLGCPSITYCDIGESKISMESCSKFLDWLNEVSKIENH